MLFFFQHRTKKRIPPANEMEEKPIFLTEISELRVESSSRSRRQRQHQYISNRCVFVAACIDSYEIVHHSQFLFSPERLNSIALHLLLRKNAFGIVSMAGGATVECVCVCRITQSDGGAY